MIEGEEEYLGDGLYASFQVDSFKLRAPRAGGDHEVWLEPQVLGAFLRYITTITAQLERRQQELQKEQEGKVNNGGQT